MSAVGSVLETEDDLQPFAIQENSILLKAISCIPIFGIIISASQEISLIEKIKHTDKAPRLIELIQIKNEYKAANITRNLLQAAFVVTGIALGFFSCGLGASMTGVFLALSGIHAYTIYQNTRVINELQSTGFRPGMLVL